jgi:uncharacterized repeat protein (TIGR01451 family)
MWMGPTMKKLSQHTACTTVDRSPLSGTRSVGRTWGRGLRAWTPVLAGLVLIAGARLATAKSVYVIAGVDYEQQQIQVNAYDLAPAGKLTFQAKGYATLYGAQALALALDSNSRHLFLTRLTSNVITVLDAVTLKVEKDVRVAGARSVTGIVYDHGQGLLYFVDGVTPSLYICRWNPAQHELTPAPGSPLRLDAAEPYGVALDEVTDELYVCNSTQTISVYSTADWRLTRTISVRRKAAHVAVDQIRGYLYYGGADLGNLNLGKYDLALDAETQVQLGPKIGVMGLGVDHVTGFAFVSTGSTTCPGCGDDVRVFDNGLVLIDTARGTDNPMGLVVSDGRTAYNPLRLTKTIKTPAGDAASGMGVSEVIVGQEVTYSICFDHNDLPLTSIVLVDQLPAELAFVRATGDGLYGRYDPQAHTYTWSNPPVTRGATSCLELVARLDPNTPVHQLVTNSVTIDSDETPPTTAEAHVVAVGPTVYQPLHVSKTVIAGATGGGLTETIPFSARPGDELTYRISFDSKGNERAVENVRLTDTLPRGTEFVRATGDGQFGRYEPLTHTYTWSYPRLGSGESNFVDLVVRVDKEAEIGSTIQNTAVLASDNTTTVKASVDVLVGSFAPLRLQKTLIRGATGQPDGQGRPYVDAGSTLTYAIYFSNPSTNRTVTNISLVDTLPREVSFVSADGDGSLGFYDPNTHTYSWHYTSLGAGLEQTLNLTVRVNDRVDPGTVISNSITIAAQQTTATKVRSDVVVRTTWTDLPLRLQKTIVNGLAPVLAGHSGGPYVYAGTELTYAISLSNPATNETATQIALVDTLPREVTFVRADDDREFGSYDPGLHTYTWRYALLAPGAEKVLNLVVRVQDNVAPGTVIANTATIRASEMPPTTARLEAEVESMSVEGTMYLKPDHIYRNYAKPQADLMVVVHLPVGIGTAAISNTALVLTPGNIKATGQQIFGTSTQGKVLCFFDVDALLAATTGYGEFPLNVTGQLKDGRTFVAQTTIAILKFGGP